MRIEPEKYLPDTSIYPGLTLAEILEEKGMSQSELAQRANRPVQAINEIINNKKEITAETALDFERVLGIDASFWLKLENNYREAIARENEKASLESQLAIASKYPYNEMATFGWVKPTRVRIERARELLRWLGVNHLENVDVQYKLAFRKSSKYALSKEKLVAWLRYGEFHFQRLEGLKEFASDSCEELLHKVRMLTLENIEMASKKLIELCVSYGIVLIFSREFRSFPVSGVTRWVAKHPLIQVTLRGKRDDKFWFSVFHELGHVYLHNRSDTYVNPSVHRENIEELEKEADSFACDHLIPKKEYESFVHKGVFTDRSVREFAGRIQIAPSIVVGRLQHNHLLKPNQLEHLKMRVKWVEKHGEGAK